MVLMANQKYAAMVMDARSGEILHSENANKRLHPASLTKMMIRKLNLQLIHQLHEKNLKFLKLEN